MASQLRRFDIEATFQKPDGQFRSVEFTLNATNGQAIWDTLQAMSDAKDEDSEYYGELVRSKIREVNEDTGEVTEHGPAGVPHVNMTVRPRDDVPRLPAPTELHEDEGLLWYERDVFVQVWTEIYPCTYKMEDEDDSITE